MNMSDKIGDRHSGHRLMRAAMQRNGSEPTLAVLWEATAAATAAGLPPAVSRTTPSIPGNVTSPT